MTLPSAFKATIIPETGDFDVIEKVDIPFQKPDIDEVVIKVVLKPLFYTSPDIFLHFNSLVMEV